MNISDIDHRPNSKHIAESAGSALRKEARTGILFALPALVFYLALTLGPTLSVLYLSLTDYDLLTPPEFKGIDNFIRLINDQRLVTSLLNTFIYVMAAVIFINGFGILFAVFLNRRMPTRLRAALRSAYFFPSLIALVYVSIIWQFFFQADTGIINYYLTEIGLPRINWLGHPVVARVSVIIVDVWRNIGFAMLIYLAALQDVPKERMEAAAVDGSGRWGQFWHVQLPAISPSVLFGVIYTMIGAWQIFESIIVLTGGGPGDATRSITMYLYEKGFQSFDMGYASAIAVLLFAVILAGTALLLGSQRRWEFYE